MLTINWDNGNRCQNHAKLIIEILIEETKMKVSLVFRNQATIPGSDIFQMSKRIIKLCRTGGWEEVISHELRGFFPFDTEN